MTEETPISPELSGIIEYANNLAWKQRNLDVLRPEYDDAYNTIVRSIEHNLRLSDWRRRLVLPDLRAHGNETVAIFTDYSGETQGDKFATYSTLICGGNLTYEFFQAMKQVRQRHDLGSKEIALKDFGRGRLRKALPEYLAALDWVPGFLFTVAIDKRLISLFAANNESGRAYIADALDEAGLGKRKRKVNEKLLRIVHIVAYLAALLTHSGQKIFWMTDNDAISAPREMHQKTLTLFQRILGLYARKGYDYPLIHGALPFSERDTDMLDLLSAADVVAGSVAKYLSQNKLGTELDENAMNHGYGLVLEWLARDGICLKKMNIIMRPNHGGQPGIETAALEFRLRNPPDNQQIIPLRF